jgi:hypothetical protein
MKPNCSNLETPTSGVNLSKTDSSWAKVEGQLVTVTSGINVHWKISGEKY